MPSGPHLLMEPTALDIAVDAARGVAEVYELYPPDDRKPYAPCLSHRITKPRSSVGTSGSKRRYPEFTTPTEAEPETRAIASPSAPGPEIG